MILKVRKVNDPILRQPAERVDDFDFELEALINDMIETMRKGNGIGLAAPQVGVSKKIFVCEFEGDKEANLPTFPLTVLVNPEIVELGKEEINMVEGCLSFPGLEMLIKRPKKIKIKGQDRYGKKIEIEVDGLYSRVLQHENDHLNSTLMIDHMQEMKVIFIGTGTLGLKTLEFLIEDPQYKIISVITGAEKRVVGRKSTKIKNVILELAKKNNLPTIVTGNINDEKVISKIIGDKPDLGIMADFGQIIGGKILDIPKHGIINIHPSLLPKYRGPSPIQETILQGDKFAGVSLIKTDKKMDAGGIISQISVELSGSETSTILKKYLSDIAATLLLNSIPYYLAGDLKPEDQDETKASYTKLFKKEDGFVNDSTPAIEVERKIRAFDAWPKVYTFRKKKRVQILSAHFEEDGSFTIDRVKPEGANDMNYPDYIRGYKDELTFDA